MEKNNVATCKECGEVKPLLRSGLCSDCMRAHQVYPERSAVSYSAGAAVPGLEAKIAAQAETTEKLSDIVAGLVDTVKTFVSVPEPAPGPEREIAETDNPARGGDSLSLVNGLVLLVGAVVVIIVVALALFKKQAAVAVRARAPVDARVYL